MGALGLFVLSHFLRGSRAGYPMGGSLILLGLAMLIGVQFGSHGLDPNVPIALYWAGSAGAVALGCGAIAATRSNRRQERIERTAIARTQS